MTVRVDTHTAALLAHLAAATGRPIGNAKKPDGAVPIYGVLYRITGQRDGTLSRDDEAALTYQVTCVGLDNDGADLLAGDVEAAMPTLTVPGRRVMRVELVDDGPARRDDDTTPPLFYATPRWRLWTSPA